MNNIPKCRRPSGRDTIKNAGSAGESLRYEELATRLRGYIERGRLGVGDRLPSFVELRKEGFSIQTVERAQSLLEREGLIERRPRSGVYVAPRKESAPLGKTGIIGFCGLGFSLHDDPYWRFLLDGINAAVEHEHTQVLLLKALPNAGGWDKVDGMLLAGVDNNIQVVRDLLPIGVPSVSLVLPLPGTSSVAAEDYEGAKALTEYLLSQGHKDIACVMNLEHPISAARVRGYQDAMLAAGLDGQKRLSDIADPPDDESYTARGEYSVNALLEGAWKKSRPSAVLMHNDQAAVGAIGALQKHGLQVPQDMSVTGFDDTEADGYFRPLLTTAHVPLREIGKTGVELLLRQIHDRDAVPRLVTLATSVVARGSTRVFEG